MTGFSALVLAGSRAEPDTVAAYAGVAHKALVTLGKETLLARVASALQDAGAVRIAVVTGHEAVRDEAQRLRLEVLDQAPSPSLSVRQGVERLGAPLLVTTADHALLQAEWISRFLADTPSDVDVAALVAERTIIEAAAPGAQRTYIRLADGAWSGCNLFWLANDRALRAVDLWRRVEADRKRPWRIASLLGPGVFLRYAIGRLTLAEAAARLGRLAGCRAAVIPTPFGLASVDVDKPADLDLVRSLFAR